jgi:hypothetical protein
MSSQGAGLAELCPGGLPFERCGYEHDKESSQ